MLELVKKIYFGEFVQSNARSMRLARHIKNLMPEGLPKDTDTEKPFERAFNRVQEVEIKSQDYSESELKMALKGNLLQGFTYNYCHQIFGIPETTLKRYTNKLFAQFGVNNRKELIAYAKSTISNQTALETVIDCVEKLKPGQKCFFDQKEVDLFFTVSDMKNAAGLIQDQNALKEQAQRVCKRKAECMEEGPHQERLK